MTKYRTSNIKYRSTINLLHARRFAKDRGILFNLSLTVNWNGMGLNIHQTTTASKKLRTALGRWYKYNHKPNDFYYLEVQESPNGHTNTHWMLSMPSHLADEVYIFCQKHIKKHYASPKATTINVSKIETSGSYLKYLLKGTDPYYCRHFYINHVEQGSVIGQRVGTSRNIGRNARKKAKWNRKKS